MEFHVGSAVLLPGLMYSTRVFLCLCFQVPRTAKLVLKGFPFRIAVQDIVINWIQKKGIFKQNWLHEHKAEAFPDRFSDTVLKTSHAIPEQKHTTR